MIKYRIVLDEVSGAYRIEQKILWFWFEVTKMNNYQGNEYRSAVRFDTLNEVEEYVEYLHERERKLKGDKLKNKRKVNKVYTDDHMNHHNLKEIYETR